MPDPIVYRCVQTDTSRCQVTVERPGRPPARLREVTWRRLPRGGGGDVFAYGANGGYAYGYGGTGPMNLSRAILAHALGLAVLNQRDDRAVIVRALVDGYIGVAPQSEPFVITDDEVRAFVDGFALGGADGAELDRRRAVRATAAGR